MNDFLGGGAAIASWIVAMSLFQYWRRVRDRLLLLFSVAFGVLGLSWFLVSAFHPGGETRHFFYVPRLIAFLVILVAIVDKNRRGSTP